MSARTRTAPAPAPSDSRKGAPRVTLARLSSVTLAMCESRVVADDALDVAESRVVTYLTTLTRALDSGVSAKSHADANAAMVAAHPRFSAYVKTSPDTITQYARAGRVYLAKGVRADDGTADVVRIVTQGAKHIGAPRVDTIIATAAPDTILATIEAETTAARAAKGGASTGAEGGEGGEGGEVTAAPVAKSARVYLSEALAAIMAARAAGVGTADYAAVREIIAAAESLTAARAPRVRKGAKSAAPAAA